MYPEGQDSPDDRTVEEVEKPEELQGALAGSPDDYDKLARTLLDDDGEKIEQGELLQEATNQGVGNFIPDMMFQNISKNFQNAKQMYGPRLLKYITGYDADYCERNIKIPEFAREVQGRVSKKISELKDDGLIDEKGALMQEGVRLASMVMYMQELDHIIPKGLLGEHEHKERSFSGISDEVRSYQYGDRYKDIALKRTTKIALRRGHKRLSREDLRIFERQSKGNLTLIYAVDASGSMRGEKIAMAKKAGVALAFKATEDKNKTGVLVFADQVHERLAPTLDFFKILPALTSIKAHKETNVVETIQEAISLFGNDKSTKHLIFLTDGVPTAGENPQQLALQAAAEAKSKDITISTIGIQVDEEGETFGRQLAEIGGGNFYMINNLEELDMVVLEDYANVR